MVQSVCGVQHGFHAWFVIKPLPNVCLLHLSHVHSVPPEHCVKDCLGEEMGKLSNRFKTVARDLYSFFTNNSQAG